MARQVNTEITGKFGNLHYYKWRDLYCIRLMPSKSSLSNATLKQAGIFGTAAKISGILRKILDPVIAEPKKRSLMHRFNNAVANWMRTDPMHNNGLPLPFISGLELNDTTPIRSVLQKQPVIIITAGSYALRLPEINAAADIVAPPDTRLVLWTITILSCKMKSFIHKSYTTRVLMNYTDELLPERDIPLPLEIDKDAIIVIAAGINFSRSADRTGLVEHPQWKPASVIGAYYRK